MVGADDRKNLCRHDVGVVVSVVVVVGVVVVSGDFRYSDVIDDDVADDGVVGDVADDVVGGGDHLCSGSGGDGGGDGVKDGAAAGGRYSLVSLRTARQKAPTTRSTSTTTCKVDAWAR